MAVRSPAAAARTSGAYSSILPSPFERFVWEGFVTSLADSTPRGSLSPFPGIRHLEGRCLRLVESALVSCS